MKRLLIIAFSLFVALLVFTGCGSSTDYEDQVAELQESNQLLQEENEELQTQVDELTSEVEYLNGIVNSNEDEILQTVFWEDGKIYLVENVKFYTDKFCSEELVSEYVRFYSPQCLRIELSNGNTVYCSLSNHGIVWSVDSPRFKEIDFGDWYFHSPKKDTQNQKFWVSFLLFF